MDDNEDDSEGEDEPDIQNQNILNNLAKDADAEFNSRYGYIDLGMSVAKETGISYFELIEHPAIHVLALAQYLIEKTEKIQREYNKNKPINA